MNILVADDDEVTRNLVVHFLRAMGHEVNFAENGIQAQSMFDELACSIVISDVMMPGASGFDLCRHIRESSRENYTYIILLTAHEGKNFYLQGIEAGADDLLIKPFDGDQVRARLHVAERILSLTERIQQFEKILSVCAWCKMILDNDAWVPLEQFVEKHSRATFSHGLCRSCYERETRMLGQARA